MLHLWMPEADDAWHWSVGGQWFEAASIEALIQAIQPYHGTDTVVFFPSRVVQVIQQSISKAQLNKLGPEGVQYLLEEFVTIPVDSMKVVYCFKQPDQLFVMGIARQALQCLLDRLALLPVKLVGLLPDFLILPVPDPNQVVIADISGRLLIRENEYWGCSCDDLALYLDLQHLNQPQCYKTIGLKRAEQQVLSASVTHDRLLLADDQFQAISRPRQHPWNVLPKMQPHSAVSGYCKAIAVLILAIVFVQFGYDAVRWFKFNQLANQTAAQAISHYQEWFGVNARVSEQNLSSLFESQLRAAKIADQTAIRLLAEIGPVVMQQQMVADQVHYDASILSMRLKAKESESFNRFVQQLQQQGLKVQLGDIQPDHDGVIGMVKVHS